MRTVAERIGDRQGFIVDGQSIWNIRYADDTILIATANGAKSWTIKNDEKVLQSFVMWVW